MGNEPSKRSSTKTGNHDSYSSNGHHGDRLSHDESTELSGIHGVNENLGKIDILQSDTEQRPAAVKTLLEVANGLHVTDNVSSITANEGVDKMVLNLQDNEVSSTALKEVKESLTNSQTDTNTNPCGDVVEETDTPPSTPRKETSTTPGKDDSGVESSSDIVQVSRSDGGSKDSGTKSKANKKSKKSEDKRKANKSTEHDFDESIEVEVISVKKDKKKKPKKKISKQNSTVSDVGMTSTVSMSSGLNVSSISSDTGRGTLERSVSSVEPGFGVVNSIDNKTSRRPLSKSLSDNEQQKEKKKKKKMDKKKSNLVTPMPVPVENTNKEKRRSIFEEDFTIELGLAEENLDVVSLSSLSSVDGKVECENGHNKRKQGMSDQQNDYEDSSSRRVSEYNVTLRDSSTEECEKDDSVCNEVMYERKITVITHEPVSSETNLIETKEENNNLEAETKPEKEITEIDLNTDALHQISINYNSENEEGDETVSDSFDNYSLVDQIVAQVSREYDCNPHEILTKRNRNGLRRIGHSQSMSPTDGGKLHRPVRRQCSEDVTRTRLSNPCREYGSESDFHDQPRRVILTRPLSFDRPSSSSPSSTSIPSKKRQNSFSEMFKKSTTALTHHRRKSENKGEPLKEQNVGKTGDDQTATIVYM
ncbi:uncharacterized protein LOC132561795 [Ylistrum balloti]|uniref:uncharacterized protein LOC132561795 n=1 Tax=Ylistrum balloti TaxID=509963 RepID=UPI002905A15F|nr:uncharacterized protein LOC132561795 [Ylistrum balloti]